jgi:aspartyl-tRNA(Asn)/glutamyl-tRNA(Gln) amidotransferase subunit A
LTQNSSFSSQKDLFDNGSLSVVETVDAFLSKCKDRENLNAFLEIYEDEAKTRAKEIDQKIKAGSQGRLAGMVVGLKDNIAFKNHKFSASSKILEGFESQFTATAVQRLLDEDAIIIGRLNCDEFAMGSSNENSAFGDVSNHLNEDYVPGGSSGGSAVAVGAGLCHVSLGSDTGGSIRQPASFTGIVGFKPTYGRISRYGLIAYASSFDQIGPFTNDVDDCALVSEIMFGKDDFDSTLSLREVPKLTDISEHEIKRVAYIKEIMEDPELDAEIKEQTWGLINTLKEKGYEVNEVSFPYLDKLVPTYYVLTTAEASSNLSRFDGVHYGYQSKDAEGIDEIYKNSRSEGFGPEVKRRIMAGTFVLSHGYYDAYYSQGQKVRRVIQDKTNEIFESFDMLIGPTTPTTAFKKNSVKDPIKMYLQDIYTVHSNLSGNPSISIPFKIHTDNKMPYGIQLMGKHFDEKNVLSFAKYLSSII